MFIDLCFFNFLNLLLGGDSELDFLPSLNDIGSSSIDDSKSHMKTFQFQMEPLYDVPKDLGYDNDFDVNMIYIVS